MIKNDLADTLHSAKEKMLATFPFMAQHNWYAEKKIILFGTGGVYNFDSKYFYENGIEVYALCDNNPKKWDTLIDGVQVLPPDELCKLDDCFVFILASYTEHIQQIQSQLQDMGIPCIPFIPYIILHEHEQVLAAYELLSDKESQVLYYAAIAARLGLAPVDNEHVMADQYFAVPFFKFLKTTEVFVDVGAFSGSVTEAFINSRLGCFKRIFCIEPETRAFQALQNRISRLKKEWVFEEDAIQCYQVGIGAYSGEIALEMVNAPTTSRVKPRADGGPTIQLHRLDDLFADERVDFIKADIEGAEMDMLVGGKSVIARDKPLLAISAYHRIDDLYRLALFLKKLVPEYKFAIRQHALNLLEMVLYCYV